MIRRKPIVKPPSNDPESPPKGPAAVSPPPPKVVHVVHHRCDCEGSTRSALTREQVTEAVRTADGSAWPAPEGHLSSVAIESVIDNIMTLLEGRFEG